MGASDTERFHPVTTGNQAGLKSVLPGLLLQHGTMPLAGLLWECGGACLGGPGRMCESREGKAVRQFVSDNGDP